MAECRPWPYDPGKLSFLAFGSSPFLCLRVLHRSSWTSHTHLTHVGGSQRCFGPRHFLRPLICQNPAVRAPRRRRATGQDPWCSKTSCQSLEHLKNPSSCLKLFVVLWCGGAVLWCGWKRYWVKWWRWRWRCWAPAKMLEKCGRTDPAGKLSCSLFFGS